MAGLSLDHPWAFTFGILGNVISIMVYLAPFPTFRRVYRRRSTEGFQSVPYVVALFSAMLWIYYALVKTNATLLITINAFGCIIESIYIIIFITYAPRMAKIFTAKILLLLNVGILGLIVILTLLLLKGSDRVVVVGWFCVGFSVCVFVAPLSIIRLVIRTRSVEFMPFSLSLFLTLSAIAWFFYGLATKDKYVAIPNILGFLFGVIQMGLYAFYKGANKAVQEHKLPEHIIAIARLGAGIGSEVHPIDTKARDSGEERKGDDQGKECELTDGVDKEGMGVQEEIVMSHTEV